MTHTVPRYLFDSLDAVRRQLQNRDSVPVFLDLDGTLAAITPTPKLTRLKPETRVALKELAQDQRFHISVVSGRAMQDLMDIVNLPGITYAGNHGLEIAGPGLTFIHEEAKRRTDLIRTICATLISRLRSIKGVIVEFKTLTASVHYRLVTEREIDRIRTAINEAIAPYMDQLCITEGRKVLELRPAMDWDKGSAVKWILGKTGHDVAAAIYVGDDKTDEDAFRALPRSITINVGSEFGITAARYFVRSPKGVLAFIQNLPRIHRPVSRTMTEFPPLAFPASAGD
jgi:trehalose 6-phosphate phosphatase